jgi:hypothetical protein
MERTVTHPSAEKLQTKFHNLGAKKAAKSTDKKVHFASLQHEFNIRDEFADVEREFEIQYEQFLSNKSEKRLKRTQG